MRGHTPAELIETYVAGLLELPGWLSAMGGQLEDLEDSSIKPLSLYYIPNVTFPQLPSAQDYGWCYAGSNRLSAARRPPAVRACGTCLITRSASRASQYGAPPGCASCSLMARGGCAARWSKLMGVFSRSGCGRVWCLPVGGFAYAEELKRAYLSPGRAGALGWPGKR